MTTYSVLQNQAGIQFQGVKDKSEANRTASMVNFIMAGQFKRGRFDKPFMVTMENIRAKLGYDPQNPDYVAVEDALSDGAPYIYVQRVVKGGTNPNPNPNPDPGDGGTNPNPNPDDGGSNPSIPLECYNYRNSEISDLIYPIVGSVEVAFVAPKDGFEDDMYKVLYEKNKNLTIDIHLFNEGSIVLQVKGLSLANLMPDFDPLASDLSVDYSLSIDDCVGPLEPFRALFDTSNMVNNGILLPGVKIERVNINLNFVTNSESTTVIEAAIFSNFSFGLSSVTTFDWSGLQIIHTYCISKDMDNIAAFSYDSYDLVDMSQAMQFNGPNSITAIRLLGASSGLAPEIQCTPTIIPINNGLMGVDRVQYKYSINGGTIFTSEETTDTEARIHTNLVNFLAYSKSILQMEHTKYIGMNDYKRFLVSYDYPVQGAPSNGNLVSPMTVEFWAIPGADNCFATIAFGGDFVLRSCGPQYWTENNVVTDQES